MKSIYVRQKAKCVVPSLSIDMLSKPFISRAFSAQVMNCRGQKCIIL